MSLTLTGWLLAVTSITFSALMLLRLGPLSEPLDKAAPVSSGSWLLPVMAFLLVAGMGAAALYLMLPPWSGVSKDFNAPSASHPGTDSGEFARLKNYARSIGSGTPESNAVADTRLPDVDTLIEQLATRLSTAPHDLKGWRMLGWSYYNTGRFAEAATAYAKAVEIDPDSTELKLAHDDAKARAAESSKPDGSLSLGGTRGPPGR